MMKKWKVKKWDWKEVDHKKWIKGWNWDRNLRVITEHLNRALGGKKWRFYH